MQYSAHGRKLAYGHRALIWMVMPLLAWMIINIVAYGLGYWLMENGMKNVDAVNYNSRVQEYSKHHSSPHHDNLSIDASRSSCAEYMHGKCCSFCSS